MSMPFITISNLKVLRDGETVLAIDKLEIEQGDVIAVVGPNGAGKSSLLLAITRLLPHAQGNIVFTSDEGKTVSDLQLRRRLALVMQEPLLIDASVRDNIALGLLYRHTPKETIATQVETWARRFNIQNLLEKPATKISGGEAQRASLARAFAVTPSLLLLDEPFSSLDPQTRRTILADLRKVLAEAGTTTILVTHDPHEVKAVADKIAVIWKGKLVYFGPKVAIKKSSIVDDRGHVIDDFGWLLDL